METISKLIEELNFGDLSMYGRSIPIIASDSIRSFFKEKRFYIAFLYYVIVPLFLVIIQSSQPVIQTGTGIAVYYAQLNTTSYIKTLFLSFFPGQIFLVILSADLIAGEVEQETFPLLYAKPIFGSEIIIGKFLGITTVLAILETPTLIITYLVFLVKYKAEWHTAYLFSVDEVLMMIIIVVLLQSIIIAISLLISTVFERSLYAILSSILALFIVSSISDSVSDQNITLSNYLSFNWLLDAVLPNVFFNLDPLEEGLKLIPFVIFLVLITIGILVAASLILRRREIY